MKKASVTFQTTDADLQKAYDVAVKSLPNNIKAFGDKMLTVTGAGYEAVWPETTPVEGRMLYNRYLPVAVDAQKIWMQFQRNDGCIPGMIQQFITTSASCQPGIAPSVAGVSAIFGWIQGWYFPRTALDLYYLADLDENYLRALYDCCARADAFLWSARDDDQNGCLESWCEWDLGDDNAWRYHGAPYGCPDGKPPKDHPILPMESVDMMSVSYGLRDTCAKIAAIWNSDEESVWRKKAEEVQNKIRSYLWREDKGACYNRDKNNEFMDELEACNLRALYFGSFTQEMADRFIKDHLKNPEEFWTPIPLPSVARNNPFYRQYEDFSSMSGPVSTIHLMRTILGLDDYGHPAEITQLLKPFRKVIARDGRYEPFYDPITTEPNGLPTDGCSTPGMVAMLSLIALSMGVWITPKKEIYFAAIESDANSVYTQVWGEDVYSLEIESNTAHVAVNGEEKFSFPAGFRAVTDMSGKLLRIVRIEESEKTANILGHEITLQENEVYVFE